MVITPSITVASIKGVSVVTASVVRPVTVSASLNVPTDALTIPNLPSSLNVTEVSLVALVKT